MSRERGIIFQGDMVRALLAGTKAQTRRLCAVQPVLEDGLWHTLFPFGDSGHGIYETELEMRAELSAVMLPRCPYGKPGDRLYVRENYYCDHFESHNREIVNGRERAVNPRDASELAAWLRVTYYNADYLTPKDWAKRWEFAIPGWKPSIHMPRWAARIWLEITDVRIERLHDIDPQDVREEGLRIPTCDCEVCMRSVEMCPADQSAHIMCFAQLWDSINGDRCPWHSNPWLWAITFKRIEAP